MSNHNLGQRHNFPRCSIWSVIPGQGSVQYSECYDIKIDKMLIGICWQCWYVAGHTWGLALSTVLSLSLAEKAPELLVSSAATGWLLDFWSGIVFSLHNVASSSSSATSVLTPVIMTIGVAMETRPQHWNTQIPADIKQSNSAVTSASRRTRQGEVGQVYNS